MSRLNHLFKEKSQRVLNVYCTAGFPQLESTVPVLKALQEHGADIIELGMPYSDPLADGPVIQASNSKALENGMRMTKLFEQLSNFRKDIHIPVVLMGYMNPVLQYGFEKFCSDAKKSGIDGLILPDMPVYEYEKTYKAILDKMELDLIFLVTPETSDLRIQQLDAMSSGFLYAVSTSSITGTDTDFGPVADYFNRLKKLNLKNPILAGFGIKDKKSFETVCAYTNGAIIGSAYIKVLEHSTDINKSTKEFIRSILH